MPSFDWRASIRAWCAHAPLWGRSVIGCGSAGSRSILGSTPMPAGGRPRRPGLSSNHVTGALDTRRYASQKRCWSQWVVASPPRWRVSRRWRWWVRSWGLTAQEQDEVWGRWRQGESLRLIARRLGKRGLSVRAFVLQTGGVQRHPPRRAPRWLGMAEGEEISRGVAAGESWRQIAARLGGGPATGS